MQAIFTGNVREWSEVPGSKMTGPIDLVDRIASSGTQDAFQNIFLGRTLKISKSAEAEETNGLVQNKVKVDEHAIGFVSFAFTGGVHTVGYQGIPCTLQNAKSGQYQGVRNFWMVTKGAPKGAAAKFIEWVDSSKQRGRPQDHQPPSGSRSTSRARFRRAAQPAARRRVQAAARAGSRPGRAPRGVGTVRARGGRARW